MTEFCMLKWRSITHHFKKDVFRYLLAHSSAFNPSWTMRLDLSTHPRSTIASYSAGAARPSLIKRIGSNQVLFDGIGLSLPAWSRPIVHRSAQGRHASTCMMNMYSPRVYCWCYPCMESSAASWSNAIKRKQFCKQTLSALNSKNDCCLHFMRFHVVSWSLAIF